MLHAHIGLAFVSASLALSALVGLGKQKDYTAQLSGALSAATRGQTPLSIGIATEDPEWSRETSTQLGASAETLRTMRLATVIVKTDSGWGSGALVKGGIVVTNYHVVESTLANALLSGKPKALNVIYCSVSGSRVSKGATSKAEILRVDRAHDLALLKVATIPEGVTPFRVKEAELGLGELVYAIGSQGGGLAWAIKLGTVSGVYDYPAELTDNIVLTEQPQDEEGPVQRLNANVVVTDCTISPGDSGGPLVNEAGELVGLTFATPTNLTQGAVGYHIAAEHIAGLLAASGKVDGAIPPDLWTAASSNHLGTAFFPIPDLKDERRTRMLFGMIAGQSTDGTPAEIGRMVLYADDPQAPPTAGGTHSTPMGLGLPGATFRADRFLIWKSDGTTISGLMDGRGEVIEIRVASSRLSKPKIRYKRARGKWSVELSPRCSRKADDGLKGRALSDFNAAAEFVRTTKL